VFLKSLAKFWENVLRPEMIPVQVIALQIYKSDKVIEWSTCATTQVSQLQFRTSDTLH
jgi:hypothetical protein